MRSRLVLALALALATLAVSAVGAVGHAMLVSSDPVAGGTLTTTPYTLRATFSEELAESGSSIVVEDASGAQVASGEVAPDDNTTMVAELPALADGTYTVRWTTLTADDNATERGTYTFSVGSSAQPQPTPAATPAPDASGSGASNTDVLIALAVAAVAVALVVGFVLYRNRR
jgi:methionine-rich copper-binding protein CopC